MLWFNTPFLRKPSASIVSRISLEGQLCLREYKKCPVLCGYRTGFILTSKMHDAAAIPICFRRLAITSVTLRCNLSHTEISPFTVTDPKIKVQGRPPPLFALSFSPQFYVFLCFAVKVLRAQRFGQLYLFNRFQRLRGFKIFFQSQSHWVPIKFAGYLHDNNKHNFEYPVYLK